MTLTALKFLEYFRQHGKFPSQKELGVTGHSSFARARKEVSNYLWEILLEKEKMEREANRND